MKTWKTTDYSPCQKNRHDETMFLYLTNQSGWKGKTRAKTSKVTSNGCQIWGGWIFQPTPFCFITACTCMSSTSHEMPSMPHLARGQWQHFTFVTMSPAVGFCLSQAFWCIRVAINHCIFYVNQHSLRHSAIAADTVRCCIFPSWTSLFFHPSQPDDEQPIRQDKMLAGNFFYIPMLHSSLYMS